MRLCCVTCGDMVVSLRSHTPFCKGVNKGRPWLVLPLTKELARIWGDSIEFHKWAKSIGVNLSKFQEEKS